MAQIGDTFEVNGWVRLSALLKTGGYEGGNLLTSFSIRNRDAAVECAIKLTSSTTSGVAPSTVGGPRVVNGEGWGASNLNAYQTWLHADSAINVDITASDN